VSEQFSLLYNDEIRELYTSKVMVLKSRKSRQTGYATRMEKTENVYRIVVGKSLERDHLEDVEGDGMMALG